MAVGKDPAETTKILNCDLTKIEASRKLNVLRSVRYLSRKTLDILYKVTVLPTVDYGIHVFTILWPRQIGKGLHKYNTKLAN